MATPLRALVIGAGPMADFMHLPILAQLRDAGTIELSLICDLDSARGTAARRKFGFDAATGDAVGALARDDIDLVYIFASAQLHYEYGMLALAQGKHLFVEKPVAPSFAEAERLASLARDRGLVAVGGHNRRFYRSLTAIHDRMGRAGWRYAEAVFHKPMLGVPPQFGAASWLSANGIHALDALLFLMGGMPERIAAIAGDATRGPPGAFSALMQWSDGRQGVFLCNNTAGNRREEYILHAPGETCTATETTLTVEQGQTEQTSSYPTGNDSFVAEHAAFLDAIASGGEPVHAVAAIAPSLWLCELIERGFHGAVSLPGANPAPPPLPIALDQAILVSSAATLLPSLARLLPDYRLVSEADVAVSAGPRPEIVAALLGRGAPPLAADTLDKLPRLAVVGVAGLSVARYEPDALMARGITLVNASAAYAESVAEFALGLAILGRRRAFPAHEIMRAGGRGIAQGPSWLRVIGRRLRPFLERFGLGTFARRAKSVMFPQSGLQPQARDLAGALVGLVGWGANARAFTRRLHGCNARVIVFSEYGADDDIRNAGATRASLDEVLAADIVSCHRGLTDRTRHAIGARELARLRPGAVLINVARGALIEPRALLARLRRGDMFACLDSYDPEPLPKSDPLRRLPNVFLTPHIAGGSTDMHAAATDEVVYKIAAALAGRQVQSITAGMLRSMT